MASSSRTCVELPLDWLIVCLIAFCFFMVCFEFVGCCRCLAGIGQSSKILLECGVCSILCLLLIEDQIHTFLSI